MINLKGNTSLKAHSKVSPQRPDESSVPQLIHHRPWTNQGASWTQQISVQSVINKTHPNRLGGMITPTLSIHSSISFMNIECDPIGSKPNQQRKTSKKQKKITSPPEWFIINWHCCGSVFMRKIFTRSFDCDANQWASLCHWYPRLADIHFHNKNPHRMRFNRQMKVSNLKLNKQIELNPMATHPSAPIPCLCEPHKRMPSAWCCLQKRIVKAITAALMVADLWFGCFGRRHHHQRLVILAITNLPRSLEEKPWICYHQLISPFILEMYYSLGFVGLINVI